MRLLKNRLLVKPIKEEVKTHAGIIIPKTVDGVSTIEVEVVLLGESSSYGRWWVSVGDIVKMDNPAHTKTPVNEVEYNGEVCFIINENDIIKTR